MAERGRDAQVPALTLWEHPVAYPGSLLGKDIITISVGKLLPPARPFCALDPPLEGKVGEYYPIY